MFPHLFGQTILFEFFDGEERRLHNRKTSPSYKLTFDPLDFHPALPVSSSGVAL